MLQRGGKVIAKHVENSKRITLINEIIKHVKEGFKINTDENKAYYWLYSQYEHKTVNHSQGRYVSEKNIHTNSIESFWSTLKRGLIGIYHQVSKTHLQGNINEFCFRYNNRSNTNIFNKLIINTVL